MIEVADLILRSGSAGVELALFVLLPVMVVMLTFMRLLEAKNVLDKLVGLMAPVLGPLGIPGLGVFALIQILLVGVAAPLATLAMMDKSGASRRHIATVLALVMASAQANVVFPMAAYGLQVGFTILVSILAGLVGATFTYHVFARHLPDEDEPPEPQPKHPVAEDTRGVLSVINRAGREAFAISVGAIPMLILALLLVNVLRAAGVVDVLESVFAPLFETAALPSATILPIITKFIAGGTAMRGVMTDFLQEGLSSVPDFNRLAGFLIHPFDVAGVAILLSAGPRVASVLRPAIYGAVVAIVLRSLAHYLLV
jgi:spore maturation protein SpmB